MKWFSLFALFFLFSLRLEANECSGCMKIDKPLYEGGLYGGFTWLYFLPAPSDGDLQFGTALTLTGPPLSVDETQNLNARVLQIEPDYTSAYRFNLGYAFACTNAHLDLDYFYYRASDSKSATSPVRNAQTYQFLQNFLGGGFVSTDAHATQCIDQADLSIGQHYILDNCVNIHPYIGISFAYITRTLDVAFSDFVVPPFINPLAATLTGSLCSQHWGVGPTFGTSFSLPIGCGFEFSGCLGLTALGAKICSDIDSNSLRGPLAQSFNAKKTSYRIAPVARSDLGLTYSFPICNNTLALSLSAGYEVDYYFRVVDRVNPDNGYVNNLNAVPKTTTSSLGLGGPYALIALTTASLPLCTKNLLTSHNIPTKCGFYAGVENSWLKPCPTSKDLTYAILHLSDGTSHDQEIEPLFSWSGSYQLGYHLPSNLDLEANYRYFYNSKSDSVTAGPAEGISSLNASGPSGVLFSHASSRVNYRLHQFDLSLGKEVPLCGLDLYGFVGLRYCNLDRTLHNAFEGGNPPLITESKFPVLKSHYWGVGPLMGIKPVYYLCNTMGLKGLFDIALLVGNSNSKLDQVNFGTVLDETSNTLRTGNLQTIVPIIDTKIGVFWIFEIGNCLKVVLEAGYLFSDYFKAINLVFPNFLTGLGQNNSNLLLSGPYFTLNISGF